MGSTDPYRPAPKLPRRIVLPQGLTRDEKDLTMRLVAQGMHPTYGECLAEVFEGKSPAEVMAIVMRSYASRIKLYQRWDAQLHHIGHGVLYLCPNDVVRCVVCCRFLGQGYTIFHTVLGPCCLSCWEMPDPDKRVPMRPRQGWWSRLLSRLGLA